MYLVGSLTIYLPWKKVTFVIPSAWSIFKLNIVAHTLSQWSVVVSGGQYPTEGNL